MLLIQRVQVSKNRLTFSVNKKLKEDYIKFWKDKLSLNGSEERGNKLRMYRKSKEKYEIGHKMFQTLSE